MKSLKEQIEEFKNIKIAKPSTSLNMRDVMILEQFIGFQEQELKAEREKLIQSKSSEDVDISLEDYCFIQGRIAEINELLGEENGRQKD